MTELKQRFIEDMQLRHLSPRTIEAYVFHVRRLAGHFGKSPDNISDEELRAYFLHIRNIQNWSRTAIKIALCAIKRFYVFTLDKPWPALQVVLPKKDKKIPPILSIDEVHRILNLVRIDNHRACLKTLYSLGLRLGEACCLQVSHIDSQRMVVHIHGGKGSKDRLVPLPQKTLCLLRSHWRTHRNPTFLFPAPGRGDIHMPTSNKGLPKSSLQIAFRQACRKAGITKKVSPRHLRHAYTIHLLEAGVPLRFVQHYLGHSDPRTTMIYAQLINPIQVEAIDIINAVMEQL
jgi:site-specific recombinase XerD